LNPIGGWRERAGVASDHAASSPPHLRHPEIFDGNLTVMKSTLH
jgi:hypothetical protein